MHVINVVAKALVLVVGLCIAIGIEPSNQLPSPMREIFGVVVTLFGAYRLATYFFARRRELE